MLVFFFFVMTYLKIRYLSAVYMPPTCCFQISLKAACWYFFFCNDLFENTLLVCCVYATNMLLSNIPEGSMLVFFFVIRYLSAVYMLPTRCFKFLWGRWCWWYFFLYVTLPKYAVLKHC